MKNTSKPSAIRVKLGETTFYMPPEGMNLLSGLAETPVATEKPAPDRASHKPLRSSPPSPRRG